VCCIWYLRIGIRSARTARVQRAGIAIQSALRLRGRAPAANCRGSITADALSLRPSCVQVLPALEPPRTNTAGTRRRAIGRKRNYIRSTSEARFRDFEISGRRSHGGAEDRRKQREESATRHKGNWRVSCFFLCVKHPWLPTGVLHCPGHPSCAGA
jgi:hypothetical protein